MNSWAQSFNFNEDIMQICQYFAFNSGYVFQSRPIKTKNFRIVDSLRPQSHDDIRLLQGGWLALPFKARSRPTLPPTSKWTFHLMRNSPRPSRRSAFPYIVLSEETSLVFVFSPKLSIPCPSSKESNSLFRATILCTSLSKIALDALSYKGLPQVYSIPI